MATCWEGAPMTMRSGRSVSSMAEPSRRNSGFDTTSNSTGRGWWRPMTSRTSSPVPTGTVDGHASGRERLDLGAVVVHAHHVVAEVGEDRPGDEPDIACADDADVHGCALASVLGYQTEGPAGQFAGSGPAIQHCLPGGVDLSAHIVLDC